MKTNWFYVIFACLTGIMPLFAQQQPEPLPIDPDVRYGKLKNGLTYYIRHNELPKERAEFYIAQNVGSILEDENQRGLAHFLEHMAFNGTKHFPNKEIIEYTEGLGMRFGESLNAYTGFDETVYMLMNTPVTREEVIDSCLLILHDWSNFLTLPDSMIEKERKVIREEWRTRRNDQSRIWEQQLPKIYRGSRYADRMPIGTIDVLDNFKPEALRAYYSKWYRPDLQAIIIVGDIDADEVEQKIKTIFADIPAPVRPARREYFGVPDNKEPIVSIGKDKEALDYRLYLFYKHDKMSPELRATKAGLTDNYLKRVSAVMMNERFYEIVQQADPPFTHASALGGNYLFAKTKGAWTTSSSAKEGRIGETLELVVKENERVRQYGFTKTEYERARTEVVKAYESIYNERDNRENESYASEYLSHFSNGGYIPDTELEYNMIRQTSSGITVETVNEYMKRMIDDKNIVISLTGPDKQEAVYPTEAELLAMYTSAKEIPLLPYEDTLSDGPLIPVKPAPGKIVREQEDPRFGATVMTLSNGVKVVLKHTEFKKDQILMAASSPGGSTLVGDEDSYNLKVLNEVVPLGGWGNYSSIDLGKILTGKKVKVYTLLNTGNENVNGFSSPADIETMFELIYLGFTAPRMDEEAFTSYVNRTKAQQVNYHLNPSTVFVDTLLAVAFNGNPRALRVLPKDFEKISYDRIIQIYKERFADASDFVFMFTGNIDIDAMRPLIEQYLATLPSLKRVEEGDADRFPALRKGVYASHFNREMETPKTTIGHVYWAEMDYTLDHMIQVSMLEQLLDMVYLEKVREKEGGTYGVKLAAYIAPFPEGQTILQILLDTDPGKKDKVNAIVKAELQSIAANGPRESDFNKTTDNLRKKYDEGLQQNGYWLAVLDNYYGKGFDMETDYLKTLGNITPEKIRNFAKKILDQGNHVEVIMEP